MNTSQTLLDIKNLSIASAEGKPLLHELNLKIEKGQTHVLMGPNGAGKSTFGSSLLANPAYKVTAGKIILNERDITNLAADKRAQSGLFLSFQTPLAVPGVSVTSFLNAAAKNLHEDMTSRVLRKKIQEAASLLHLPDEYLKRDLNVGFSGGERKKLEMLQLLLLDPQVAILDETDSGLDVDAVKILVKAIENFRTSGDKGIIIISHNMNLLNRLPIDKVHILVKGRLVAEGDRTLIDEVDQNGFTRFEKLAGEKNG